MKIDIQNSYAFIDYMMKFDMVKQCFSVQGLHALYDYLEEFYLDEYYEVNAVDLCIYYSEYDSIDEVIENYYDGVNVKELSAEEKIDMLEDYTMISIPHTKRYIVNNG